MLSDWILKAVSSSTCVTASSADDFDDESVIPFQNGG